jgi:hypothetical protein
MRVLCLIGLHRWMVAKCGTKVHRTNDDWHFCWLPNGRWCYRCEKREWWVHEH